MPQKTPTSPKYYAWNSPPFSPSMLDMKINKYSKKLATLISLTLLLAGCAPGYMVRVDSIQAKPAESHGKKYFLTSGMQDIPANDLYFQEFSTLLVSTLKSKGYENVPDRQLAEIIIRFSYGVSKGENVYYTYIHPVYGFTGGGSVTYRETREESDGTKSTVSGVVTVPLSYHVIGHRQETGNEVVYTSFYTLEALSLTAAEQIPSSLWKTTVKTTTFTTDLRTTMPIMLRASAPFVGENTGREKQIHLSRDQVNNRQIIPN